MYYTQVAKSACTREEASCHTVACYKRLKQQQLLAGVSHHALEQHMAAIKMPSEPDLSMAVDLASDRLAIRNIIYTAWSVFNSCSTSGSAPARYSSWDVQKMAGGRGYVLHLHFGRGFRISLSDMQTLQDACPLRIDTIYVREADPGSGDSEREAAAATLCICILNGEQPVQLTETDIVRIRKRSRGLLEAVHAWIAPAAAASHASKKR